MTFFGNNPAQLELRTAMFPHPASSFYKPGASLLQPCYIPVIRRGDDERQIESFVDRWFRARINPPPYFRVTISKRDPAGAVVIACGAVDQSDPARVARTEAGHV